MTESAVIDTTGILIHVCEYGHRMKWSTSRKDYKHMEGDEARCASRRVQVVPLKR